MEPVEKGKAAMIASIEADALKEKENILKEAEVQAAEKHKYAEQKIASLLQDATEKAQAQAEAIKAKALSEVDMEIKRHRLHERNALIRDILKRVEQTLQANIENPDYPSVLLSWIMEAALGLDTESAYVNASAPERPLINDQLLAEACKALQERTGKEITLTLAESPPLPSQGVVLYATDGRTAFNNQVGTRMSRKQGQIQKMIYQALFQKESS